MTTEVHKCPDATEEVTRQFGAPIKDGYYPPITSRGENCIVNVYRPILDEEERERRIEEIKQEAKNVVRAIMREKRKKLREEGIANASK